MTLNKEDMDKLHRKLGVDLFNQTWSLLDNLSRSNEEDFLMIHIAHTSLYHWTHIGSPTNIARGEWLISHVYAVLELGESALLHGERSLEICLANSIGDFDLAFGYEAIARAYKVLNQAENVTRYTDLARLASENIDKPEDRDYFLRELFKM